jgi:ribosomal protein S25
VTNKYQFKTLDIAAREIVMQCRIVSAATLQRRLNINIFQAWILIDGLQDEGVLGIEIDGRYEVIASQSQHMFIGD